MSGSGQTSFNNGTLTIDGIADPSIAQVSGRTINTRAITNWIDQGQHLDVTAGATWNNEGTFTRTRTGAVAADLRLSANSAFNNSGTFIKNGTTAFSVTGGTFTNSGVVRAAEGTFNFTGTVLNQSGGTLRTAGGTLNLSGPITNSGSIRAENGNITISGNFTNNGGDLVAVGSNTISINSGTFTHNGGKLIVDGGNIAGSAALAINTVGSNVGGIEGVGTITQNVTMNAGTYIAPGNSPGLLTFNNNLTMNGGELRIEIGGTNWGVDTDLINVLGTANMTNITVDASLISPFEPASVGQQFLFFTAANDLTANLATWSLSPTSTAFSGFALSGNGQSVFLVSAVPEPSSLALLGLCTGLGLFARKRRAAANV
jgi:hypothetical protein